MTHILRFREDSTFTIAQFTDLHVKNGEPEDELTAALMAAVLDSGAAGPRGADGRCH